ncbi:MAG: hypothetical protein ABRQ39_28070 [Candidatus Eremiobacterota bacterium]
MKKINCKKKKERGMGLLAITMVFAVGMSLLAGTALLTATNTSNMSKLISDGDQAEQIANVGIDRVSWMIIQKCLQDNSLTNINYNNTALGGDDSSSCSIQVISTGSVPAFLYPTNDPAGRYKVRITNCSPIKSKVKKEPGKKIIIEALGQVHGVTRRVTKTVEVYEASTNLFSKAIMGNNIPGCMFCHLNIYGDIGCMGQNDGIISHAGNGSGSSIHGTFYANGGVLNKNLWSSNSDYVSDASVMGDANSTIIRNFDETPKGKIDPLPKRMDTFANNKNYILRQCTDTSIGAPGTIKVDSPGQMIPGKLYNDPNCTTEAQKIERIKKAAKVDPNSTDPLIAGRTKPDTEYCISESTYKDPNTGANKQCWSIGRNDTYGFTGKYDINNGASNSSLNLDKTTDYDSSLTLIGTEKHPIIIEGKVYIDGDVLIRGVVSGQGVIYSSRNIYVMGDLKYKTQPDSWTNPSAGRADGKTPDQLGLVASGNVLLGDPFCPIPADPKFSSNSSNKSYNNSNNSAYLDGSEYGYSSNLAAKRWAWQGYIRSLMVDGLFDGTEQGSSNNQFAKQYTNSYPSSNSSKGPHDEYFFHHNRYAWDGKDAGDTRVTRKLKAFAGDSNGPGPNVSDGSVTAVEPAIVVQGGKKYIPEKVINDSPGLLPRGASVTDNTDANTPSTKYSDKYIDTNCWIPFKDWANFTKRTKIMDPNGVDYADGNIPGSYKGSPAQIDGIMYAEGCIAGGNFVVGNRPVFHGAFVSNDTHYINAADDRWGSGDPGTTTTIYHDKRATATFMGFPCEIKITVVNYEIKSSSNSEFESY